jgi:hypothetical protein
VRCCVRDYARLCGVVYVTLTTRNLHRKGLFLIQSYRKHVPNGRSRIERSGWRLGQWDSYRPCGATLNITGALLEEPISSQLSFKIVFEASWTALDSSVGLALLLVFPWLMSSGFRRGHIALQLELCSPWKMYTSTFLQIDYKNIHRWLATSTNKVTVSFVLWKSYAVWTKYIKHGVSKLFFAAATSPTALPGYRSKVPDPPCCPEPHHAYSLRLRSGSTRVLSLQSRIPWDHSQKPVTKPGSQRTAKGRLHRLLLKRVSLPRSQKPATGPYSDSDESSPHPHIFH